MRVTIAQPLIPAYRRPLFESLGALPDIELTVLAGPTMGSLRGFETGASFRFAPAPVRQWAFGFRGQWAQLRALIGKRPDLLIVPWDIHYLTLGPTVALARARRVPIILWGHGYSQRPHPLTDAARNACGRFADGVLLYTRSVAAQLIADGVFPAERVFIAQNALDQAPIQAARQHWLSRPQELEKFREEHGIDPAQTVVFISRLETGNHIELLLQATRIMCQTRPQLKTIIVGDGSHRHQLEQLAHSLGIGDRVIFTGALYDETLIAPWMMSSSVFCYPANIGLSLLHAFGYGVPVVTTNNSLAQNPEFEALIDGSNGLLYRDGDLQDMVRRCTQLLDDTSLQRKLSVNALDTVLERYSMENMVKGFTQIFAWVRRRRDGRSQAARGEI